MADDGPMMQQAPGTHRTDPYAEKLEKKVENLQQKRDNVTHKQEQSKGPAGGFDDTPIPSAPPGYTLKFTFHRASHLPFADLNTLSSDPFVSAQLKVALPTRHKQDPPLRFRSRTIQKTVEPEWNAEWIVANVPSSGFDLKIRLYDEDPSDHDDRLGNVHINVNGISEQWPGIKEETYKVEKKGGSKRAYVLRGCWAVFNKGFRLSGEMVVSVELLGRTEGEHGGRVWTVGPCSWTRHFSPMIGMMVGTKDTGEDKGDGKPKTEKYE